MKRLFKSSGLEDIYQKVVDNGRISESDALRLYHSRDLNLIGTLANIVRERKNGNYASYIINRYINYSNVCVLNCQFCAFAKRKRDPEAFEFSIDQIVEMARESLQHGITEIHMVGGLHPSLKFDYYLKLLRSLRELSSDLHLKCFTAIEVMHLAWISKQTIQATLQALRSAGLNSLTGGGAEIFSARVRDQICRGKDTAEEWLDVHRTWHEMGEHSTCTMLYGHVETLEERVDHLSRLRQLQDHTRGFTGFVPLAFIPDKTDLMHIPRSTGFDDLRNLAISRIFLDNFDHITGYWIGLGPSMAQVSLSYGVDDLHGTIFEEKIFHMAGANTPQSLHAKKFEELIREAGREPIQRDSCYRPVKSRNKVTGGYAVTAPLASAL